MEETPEQMHRDVIVVGASLGGMRALRHLCTSLPPTLPASVLIVWHTSALGPGVLPAILNSDGPLPAAVAVDGEALRRGRIYVAPPDRHLLLEPGRIRLSSGARENRFRPAIDPLFRSAAKAFGVRVIGVVLTGNLDDGTQGSWFVKQYGGVTVAQDPQDAEAPGMPASAIEYAVVDHVLPLAAIASQLVRLTREPVPQRVVSLGTDVMKNNTDDQRIDDLHPPGFRGAQVPLACPDCDGALWKTGDESPVRYQCHVGHQFSEQGLAAAKREEVELALWTALRVLKENAALHGTMAERARAGGRDRQAEMFSQTRDEMHDKATILRRAIDGLKP